MRTATATLLLLGLFFSGASVCAESDLGSLVRVQQGKARFKWQRGALWVELHDGTTRWTEEEAILVRNALDRLPDPLLRKAFTEMKVRRFTRDAKPVGRDGPKNDASATTVIDEGYVSYGSNLFHGLDEMRVYATVTHEIGHCAQYAVVGETAFWARIKAVSLGTPGWTSISWNGFPWLGSLKSWNGFVSDYARTNDREDFAESVEFYWLAPDELRRVSPAKYAFMRDRVFEGRVSSREVRKPDHRAIAPVRPQITSLGDRKDDFGSLVQVHGKHFMGPLDGGFNTVRYRGTKAPHLAVSRKTIYSWVPSTNSGSAPITVTTPDGKSDAAAFTITKPWWKFW